MPVLPDTPAVARVDMLYTWNGENCANVFHVRNVDEVTPPVVTDIAETFKGWYSSTWRSQLSSDITLNSIVVTDLTSPSAPRVVFTTGLPQPGSNAGDSVSNNVAGLIVHDVGFRHRGSQGRTFIPGLLESSTDGQQLVPATRGSLDGDFGALVSDLTAHSYDLGVVSYYENGILRTEGLFRLILQSQVQLQLASQRLRLTGRKRKKARRP